MGNQIAEVRHATSSALPMVVQNDDVVTPSRPRYVPPSRGIHDDWDGCKLESYTPTERQKSVIEAVKSALESKRFYTGEVLKYCIDYLDVTPEQSKVGAGRVEGGDVGMDCYFARDYLRHAQEHADARNSLAMLKPFVGQDLGTLVFTDMKRTTGMTVKALSDDQKEITLQGKRGRFMVELVCTARQIEHAMNRAFDKAMRKDTFNDVYKLNDIETTANDQSVN